MTTPDGIKSLAEEMREKARLIRSGSYGNDRAIATLIDTWAILVNSLPTATVHGGNCGTMPFYLFPWQHKPEYGQGHWVVVWYDDLYDLATTASDVLAALKDVLSQFESGAFVRNTDSDGCSDWAIKAIAPLKALAVAKQAVAKADR